MRTQTDIPDTIKIVPNNCQVSTRQRVFHTDFYRIKDFGKFRTSLIDLEQQGTITKDELKQVLAITASILVENEIDSRIVNSLNKLENYLARTIARGLGYAARSKRIHEEG